MENIRHALIRGSAINLMARIMGYLKYVLIAIYMGFSAETDAFFLAMAIVGFLAVFANALETVGVPQLTRARQHNDTTTFQHVFSRHLTATLLVLLSITVLFLLFSPLLMYLPQNFSVEKQHLYETFLIMLFPFALLSVLLQFFGGILRSLRRFTLFFLCELTASTTIVITLWAGFQNELPHVLVWSHLLGTALAVLMAFYFVRPHVHFSLAPLSEALPYIRRIITVAMIAGIYSIMGMVDKYFGTFLPDKYISALTYGLLLAAAPISTLKLHDYTITWLSEGNLSIRNMMKITGLTLAGGGSITLISWFILPWAIDLIFNYGHFAELDHVLLVEAARFYFLSLPLLMLWPVLYQAFQIREKLLPVLLIGIGAVIINYLLNHYFIVHLGWRIAGITIATFLSYLFMIIAGLWALRRLERHHEPAKA